jgi:parallel beta-helix repeat protein
MKLIKNLKLIVLITLVIFLVLAIMITINLSLIPSDKNENNFDDGNLRTAAGSGKIRIINNSGWVDFRNAGNCTGNGTYSDPYIIEDLVIDGGSSGTSIYIENSNVYFKIENCTLYNAEWGSDAGIVLLKVNNSQLIDNDCSYYGIGIVLGNVSDYSGGCNNNTITGNILNNNRGGMYLFDSYNNTISGNTANNNTWSGIYLIGSNYTIVSGNTMNYNKMCGINIGGGHNNVIVSGNIISNNYMQGLWMDESFNNTISGNMMNNNIFSGIFIIDSNYNIISGNTLNNNGQGMDLKDSYNNLILGNIANNNNDDGIGLSDSYNNIISGNTANNNNDYGIGLHYSTNNTIMENTANNNNNYGISLLKSDYNIVSGNLLIGNDICIIEIDCEGNIFKDNECTITPSLAYYPIILIISIPILSVSVFIIYQNHKRFRKPQEDLEFL